MMIIRYASAEPWSQLMIIRVYLVVMVLADFAACHNVLINDLLWRAFISSDTLAMCEPHSPICAAVANGQMVRHKCYGNVDSTCPNTYARGSQQSMTTVCVSDQPQRPTIRRNMWTSFLLPSRPLEFGVFRPWNWLPRLVDEILQRRMRHGLRPFFVNASQGMCRRIMHALTVDLLWKQL